MSTLSREGMPVSGQPAARILIVDDEEAQMTALCNTLRECGYETTGYTAAGPALATLRESSFDLLLSDLMMPEMDGITLLKTALSMQPELVGIIMTGEGTIATAVESMKVGALDYILKPFKLSAILPVLSRALMVRRLRIENAELEQHLREHAAKLEAANRELEAFSYSVSHDLRAPLRAIQGFSSTLIESHTEQLSGEARLLLDKVIKGALRMDQLINDLLQFSRLSRQPLTKRIVDISALVQDVLEDLRKQHPDRQIDSHIGTLPPAMADGALLTQVFINLLANAYKFTGNKEPAIVEVGCRKQDGENVYFVRDNGVGFDMRYAGKLFGVFQRMHGANEFKGTGIGLSIVQRIVQRHGGRIWAEAAVDRGATFEFTLPE